MLQTAGKQTKSTLFYGWYIVLMAFVANFMSVGTGFYFMNVFMEPLCEARNWTPHLQRPAPPAGTPPPGGKKL